MTTSTMFEEKIKWLVAEHARAILAAEKAEKERGEALERADTLSEIYRELKIIEGRGDMEIFDISADGRVKAKSTDEEVDTAIREDMAQDDYEPPCNHLIDKSTGECVCCYCEERKRQEEKLEEKTK